MDTNHPSRLTVVLGAGASHDCAGNGIHVNEQFRPPLTRDVFDPRFTNVLSNYDWVEARLDELRSRLQRDENLEAILREYRDAAERGGTYNQFREILLYFRELFWRISEDYIGNGSKLDTLVRRILDSDFDQVLFISLNYDFLLENALERYDGHAFDSMDSYIPAQKKWSLVKPHGSANWGSLGDTGTGHTTEVIRWNRYCNGGRGDFYKCGSQDRPWYTTNGSTISGGKDLLCPDEHTKHARHTSGLAGISCWSDSVHVIMMLSGFSMISLTESD